MLKTRPPQGRGAGARRERYLSARALRLLAGANAPVPARGCRHAQGARWPCASRTRRSPGHRRAKGGGNAGRFGVPPKGATEPPSLQWQGPSPLPQHHVAPCPAGGQSPRPAPAPPLAGASRPPGRAIVSAPPGPAGLQGTAARGRRGKGRSRFPPPKGSIPVPGSGNLPVRPSGQSAVSAPCQHAAPGSKICSRCCAM